MEAIKEASALPETISIEAFEELHRRCQKVVGRVRDRMLAPVAAKVAPKLSSSQVAALVGMDLKQVDYRAKKGDLPSGEVTAGRRRLFSVSDARGWSQALRKQRLRPEGAEAVTICVANFKGGVSKTTTSVTLAQGLALRGHKVLLIDADPQGSATTLFGILPELEVEEDQTIAMLCRGEQESIEYAIRGTYWDGIDLVPAVSDLFSAEFDLPSRQIHSKNFQFWNVLHHGIDNARLNYDVIVIDTPPALSYISINALMACDGVVMPLPPNALDFLSSSQFWGLVSTVTGGLQRAGASKTFEFVDVVLSKVDPDDTATPIVRDWIKAAYADKVMGVEIPLTASAGSAAAEFGTVYDQPRKRATAAYDKLVELIEDQVNFAWQRQIAVGGDSHE
jgi:chromosome partitioning protein